MELALFKQGLGKRLQGLAPYVQPISAVLLLLAGSYITYYWLSAQSGMVLP